MICHVLALRPILHITQKTLSYLHSTKIEQMTKTMVIFKTGASFLCCIRCDPIPPQTSVQRLAHTRNVTTCCWPPIGLLLSYEFRLPPFRFLQLSSSSFVVGNRESREGKFGKRVGVTLKDAFLFFHSPLSWNQLDKRLVFLTTQRTLNALWLVLIPQAKNPSALLLKPWGINFSFGVIAEHTATFKLYR